MEQSVLTLCQEALVQILWLSAPVAIVAALVGLAVAVAQAATQVQEQTVGYVPKLVAVALTLAACGGWMLTVLVRFAVSTFERIPDFARW